MSNTTFSTIFQLYLGDQFNLIYPQNIYLTFHRSRTNYQVYLTANGSRTDKPYCALDLTLLTCGNPTLPYEQNEIIFKHVFEYIKRSERFLIV